MVGLTIVGLNVVRTFVSALQAPTLLLLHATFMQQRVELKFASTQTGGIEVGET